MKHKAVIVCQAVLIYASRKVKMYEAAQIHASKKVYKPAEDSLILILSQAWKDFLSIQRKN